MTYHALWIKSKAPQCLTWPDLPTSPSSSPGSPWAPGPTRLASWGSSNTYRFFLAQGLCTCSSISLGHECSSTDPSHLSGLQLNVTLMSLASLTDVILQFVSPCPVSPPFHMLLLLVFLVIKVFPHQILSPQNQDSSLTCSLICRRLRIETGAWQAFNKYLLNESI